MCNHGKCGPYIVGTEEFWHDANSFDDIDELGGLQELIESLEPDDYLLVIDGHAVP